MIIDFHVHLEYKDQNTKYSAEEIVKAMDKANVDMSVLLGIDHADAGTKPAWVDSSIIPLATNCSDEEIAFYCSQHPDRLIGFTSINPDRYQPHKKVERSIKEF
ncbi:MAG: amidohydrolase family protein, partial [Candidatus Humimicrobiaceae bacterium]